MERRTCDTLQSLRDRHNLRICRVHAIRVAWQFKVRESTQAVLPCIDVPAGCDSLTMSDHVQPISEMPLSHVHLENCSYTVPPSDNSKTGAHVLCND